MGGDAQLLPPKMAAKYAERAKNGEADEQQGSVFIFRNKTEEITLVSLDPPQGPVTRRRK